MIFGLHRLFGSTAHKMPRVQAASRKRAERLIDTLVIVGNGFDRWLGLETSYANFRRYYLDNRSRILKKIHAKEHTLYHADGALFRKVDDAELLYSSSLDFYDSNAEFLLDEWFWGDFESNLGHIDSTHINAFFGKGRRNLKSLDKCVRSADKLLREAFCDWIASIEAHSVITSRDCMLCDGCLFINFNYTRSLQRIFGVPERQVCHIHGEASDKKSIVYGHALHPWEPERFLLQLGGRFAGLYHVLRILYQTDKQVQDNIRLLRFFLASHEVEIGDIKDVYVLGHSMSEPDFGYFEFLAQRGYPEWERHFDEAELAPIDSVGDMSDRANYEIHRFGNGEPESRIESRFVNSMNRWKSAVQLGREEAFLANAQDLLSSVGNCMLRRSGSVSESSSAQWHITCYSDKDKARVREVMERLEVKDFELLDTIDAALGSLLR